MPSGIKLFCDFLVTLFAKLICPISRNFARLTVSVADVITYALFHATIIFSPWGEHDSLAYLLFMCLATITANRAAVSILLMTFGTGFIS